MKGKIKNLIFGLLAFMIFTSFGLVAYAEEVAAEDGGGTNAGGYGGLTNFTTYAPNGAGKTASNILGFVRWIGYAVAIGMLIYIGIKYVTSPAAEKADTKQALVKYVIGAVLIAGASAISGWIFDIV